MAIDNTTINITVRNTTNRLVVGAALSISVAGKIFNLITDSTGSAVATLSLSNLTVATITIKANGYLPYKNIYTISPVTNVYDLILAIDTNQINKILEVLDENNNLINDAIVSLNGIVVGKTNSLGEIQVVTKSGELSLQVNKSGYVPVILTDVYSESNFPTRVIMSENADVANFISFQTLPYVNILFTGNGFSDGFLSDINGLAISNLKFPSGTYSITSYKEGFETNNVSIQIVPGITLYPLPSLQFLSPFNSLPIPTPIISSLSSSPEVRSHVNPSLFGALNKIETPSILKISPVIPVTSPTEISTDAVTEQDYPSEWIYPNSGEGRYFTGTQARIYIGNLFIDEIDTMQYVYHNNRIPIYGYSSTNVDAFGQGRRIVQGQISLNFVSEGYLYTVLNEYKKRNVDTSLSPAEKQSKEAINSLANLYSKQKTLLSQQLNGDSSDVIRNQIRAISNQILFAHSNLGSSSINDVKRVLAEAQTSKSPSNAIIKSVPFDILINASGGGRTTTKKLTNCLLTSNEQVWDQSDNIIKDGYGFIGVEIN